MRLTQAQVRQLSKVGEETFRVWRKALPPLGERSGRGPQFSFADVVAIIVIRKVVNGFGVQIQKLAEASPQLFEACADALWPNAAPSLLVISQDQVTLAPAALPISDLEAPALVVPLQPIIDELHDQVMQGSPDAQTLLPFEPARSNGGT